MAWIERFAPSPTGPLHLGHAFSALTAWDRSQKNGGDFLLRVEDIDQSRCRPHWEQQIYDDLAWLGIHWPKPVLRQSDRLPAYRKAIAGLWHRSFLFACSCSRKDILTASQAPQEGAALYGPDGIIYPGTCRNIGGFSCGTDVPANAALRINMPFASQHSDDQIYGFNETGSGPNGETGLVEFTREDIIRDIGDIVIARRDMGTSYHLSVVLDDAFQNVTHVTRGQDLFEATKIHVILQKLLGLPTPTYHHHRLIRDDTGKRLAKRDNSRAIAKYRAEGATPQDIRNLVGLS